MIEKFRSNHQSRIRPEQLRCALSKLDRLSFASSGVISLGSPFLTICRSLVPENQIQICPGSHSTQDERVGMRFEDQSHQPSKRDDEPMKESFCSLALRSHKKSHHFTHHTLPWALLLVLGLLLSRITNLNMFTARNAARRLARPSMMLRMTATRSLASDAQSKASSSSSSSSFADQQQQLLTAIGAFMGLVVGGAGIALMEPAAPKKKQQLSASTSGGGGVSTFQRPAIPLEDPNTPPPRPELPTIALEDVAEHCDESSLWYT